MPSITDASSPARARYGFTSAPGSRNSRRVASGAPLRTRVVTVRLSKPQVSPLPAKSRLVVRRYELMLGAYQHISSAA